MMMSPCRVEARGFAATRNVTSALPWPFVGEISEIQFGSADASHEHSGCVVTATLPTPPPASRGVDEVASDTWHFTGDGLDVVCEDDWQPAVRTAAMAIAITAIAGAARERDSFVMREDE
jgi:hypothetical protein